MRITIDTPDITCSRCAAVEAVQPHILKLAQLGPGARRPEFSVTDSVGGAWIVQAADRPAGWTAGPAGGADLTRGLCPKCSAELSQAVESFMSGGVLEPVFETGDSPPAPVMNTTPIRYLDRPPTNAIPTLVQSAPTRTTIVNHVVSSRPMVAPIPPPAPMNTRAVVTNAQMAVNTTKVSTNTLPAQRHEVQSQRIDPGRNSAVQVAGAPAPPVRAALPDQPPPVVEVGEAEPIPSMAPERSKITH